MSSEYPVRPQWFGNAKCAAAFRARMVGFNGAPWVQADLSAIAYKVFDADHGGALVISGSLVVSSVIYNTPQTDDAWPYADGFNFSAILAGTCFPAGGRLYLVEFLFTTAAGQQCAEQFEFFGRDILGL